NQTVCVSYLSNNPALPSDSICTTTNANGYYFIIVPNGSVTGPNVNFDVFTYDPCSLLPLSQQVSNMQGTVDMATVAFTVCANSTGCDASFTTSVDSLNGLAIFTFVANATGQAPFTYSWWVDGSSYSTQTVTHTFNGGTVGVFLTVTDATGCEALYGDTLYLDGNGSGCSADFWYQTNNPNSPVAAGEAVQFNYSGSQAQFNYFFWSVQGMGMVMNSYQENPVFTFPTPGSYQVCLEVYDSIADCADTYCEFVQVVSGNNGGCEANFTWYPDSLLGSPLPAVAFSDLSQGAASWFWDFGDNTFSTAQNPLHAYNSTGLYLVCLTIVSADQSCQQTFCDSVYVGNYGGGGCNAAFSTSGPNPTGFSFLAQVQDPELYYGWSVDNQFITGGAGDFQLALSGLSNGVHTICLTVIDSLSLCSDQQCQTITVGGNNCYGYISGQLYAGSNNQPLDEGVVYLITYDANTNQLTAVDSMVVDSGNYYFFGPLACGDYLIKAAAYPGSQYYSNYIPTYFGNSPFWGFAQTIALAQVNTQVTADVYLIASNNPGGPGFIGGNVTQGANKMDEGDPIANMQVMLFDAAGNAIGYTYTDENGAFGFSELAYGSYQVYVEVLGVQTEAAFVTIGPENPSVEDLQIIATETLITTGINEVNLERAVGQVYPNPIADEASIDFSLEWAVKADLSIRDLSGRTFLTETIAVPTGVNTVRLNTSVLKSGYYLLQIQDAAGKLNVTRKFMKVD
ncbi:MAG: T9SS type A sorting domain-containing protein, partial [Bacteroidetes bacterium]